MNPENLQKLIGRLIAEIGEDPKREGLLNTPERVVRSFAKLYGGYGQDPKKLIKVFTNEGCDEMIIAKDIDFFSTCEHHILPFFGRAYIGYLPNDKIIGLSKLPRMVEIFARRLQNQERLTKQIADTLNELLQPKGVGVVLRAQHLCMKARGVEKQNSEIITSAFTGLFKSNLNTRSEFLNLIR
ncbi:GTP cyclohydrolase I FolE [Candidatus Peregrinibacteria bacterium]|nr:GTP cyclohydrolase I FolE [Candidatus Peregrinibacteria bacterium]